MARNSKKITLHIKTDPIARNELHFEVQRKTRAQVFRDRTKYSRKQKHKKNFGDQE